MQVVILFLMAVFRNNKGVPVQEHKKTISFSILHSYYHGPVYELEQVVYIALFSVLAMYKL